jgi:hypothetical protein
LGQEVKTVHRDRNLALDDVTDMMQVGSIIIPTPTIGNKNQMKEFDDHLKMLVKVEKIDRHGNEKHEYRKDVDNHYGMALANAHIAKEIYLHGDTGEDVLPIFVDLMAAGNR